MATNSLKNIPWDSEFSFPRAIFFSLFAPPMAVMERLHVYMQKMSYPSILSELETFWTRTRNVLKRSDPAPEISGNCPNFFFRIGLIGLNFFEFQVLLMWLLTNLM